MIGLVATARAETWAQRLGYPADKRVVILAAGKIGLCYETNAAAAQLAGGNVPVALEAMPPAPWFAHLASWAKSQSQHDLGVSLTFLGESEAYHYGPVLPRNLVPGLTDVEGHLPLSAQRVAASASVETIEQEARAQIERCLRAGVQPTHLSPHKGFLFLNHELAGVYLRLAQEYWLPAVVVELTPEMLESFRRAGFPMEQELIDLISAYPLPKLDHLAVLEDGSSYEDKRTKLWNLLRDLPQGLSEIVLQPATQSEALQALTPRWQQHVWDLQVLADPVLPQKLAEAGIVVTTWREVMQRFDPSAAGAAE